MIEALPAKPTYGHCALARPRHLNPKQWEANRDRPQARTCSAFVATAYAAVIRPRLLRWGATDEEVRRPYPGADLIPGGTRSATIAVTIQASPSRVWPWLLQMGVVSTAGTSWDHLNNFGRRSTERIHHEWQEISIGDHLAAKPDGSEWWEVVALESKRFLCPRISSDMRGRPFDPRGARPSL